MDISAPITPLAADNDYSQLEFGAEHDKYDKKMRRNKKKRGDMDDSRGVSSKDLLSPVPTFLD